jgi:hypothetical protein
VATATDQKHLKHERADRDEEGPTKQMRVRTCTLQHGQRHSTSSIQRSNIIKKCLTLRGVIRLGKAGDDVLKVVPVWYREHARASGVESQLRANPEINQTIMLFFLLPNHFLLCFSVAEPDQNPDPHFLSPPGSGSTRKKVCIRIQIML